MNDHSTDLSTRFASELHALARQVLKRGSRWRRLGLATADAEELLQNAFVRVLEKRERIELGAVKGFFRSAVQHERLDFFRSEHARAEAEPEVAMLLRADVHRRRDSRPFRSPETEARLCEAYEAVATLLLHVSPERRAVAAECLKRILRDGELADVEEIAADLGMSRGTVGSQWARAKADIEAAVNRERAKGDRSVLAALFGLLAGFWWLVLRAWPMPGPGGSAGPAARLSPGASSRWIVAGARRAGRPWRARAGALLVCASLSLAVMTHSAVRRRSLTETTYSTVAGLLDRIGNLADWQSTAAALPDPQAPDPGVASAADRRSDLELAAPKLASPRSSVRGDRRVANISPAPEAKLGPPRELLSRAVYFFERGRADLARLALRDYTRLYPENPCPLEYSRVKAMLGSP